VKTKELLKTLFIGKNAIRLETVGSTNLVAAEYIRTHQPADGTAILANFQTSGKGQAGANWESDAGQNLLVTYILYPNFIEPKDLFMLNKAIALGVYDYVKSVLGKDVAVKWPNDIYFGDKKIGGILIENSVTFSEVNYSIVGIGININQQKFKSYIPEAVSVRTATGKKSNVEECFAGLSNCLEHRYLQLKAGGDSHINTDYKKALYRFGKYFSFRRKGIVFKARIADVLDDGKLVLEKENGKPETFRFKEIAFASDAWKAEEKNQTLLPEANKS
jgi:BirA family biotin operon repressor/biotin-[acetyl-CoA-carboxylase] ligase